MLFRSALSANEQNGLRLFIQNGCAGCHDGPGIGGANFQKFGLYEDYWKVTGVAQIDKGRADVTKNNEDLYLFKTPSLRNVARTAPYFHDGSVESLEEAVVVMGRYQLGREFSGEDVAALVAFLRTLTGEWEGKDRKSTRLNSSH